MLFSASYEADFFLKIEYSLYFRFNQITEIQTRKIPKRNGILDIRLKNQLLHTWSENLPFCINGSKTKSYKDCILILLPFSPDYGITDT